jgi:hypothetical protein
MQSSKGNRWSYPVLMGLTAGLLWPVVTLAEAVRPATSGTLVCAPEGTSVLFRQGEHLLAEYRYADVRFKPYIKQLFTPDGINVLLDSPYDHKHHRGLMYAVAAQNVGFWTEEANDGRQVHRSFRTRSVPHGDVNGVAMIDELDWQTAAGEKVVSEERTVEACAGPGIDATLLTWKTKLAAADKDKPLALKGDHYYGLGMRFVRAMDKGGQFIFPNNMSFGVLVRGDEHVTPAEWCAYTARTEGKDVTVAMFNDPANPRKVAHWFTMTKPFAYLAATLNLYREPLTLEAGQSLTLCYGVAVWDGKASPEQIGQMYQRWLELARKP